MWTAGASTSCTAAARRASARRPGFAPIAFNAATRAAAKSRSFYLDLPLIEGYWIKRGYHHTISTPLVYALHEALSVIDEETMTARSARHARVHGEFVAALAEMGLSLLPPEGERLWTLNTVRVPERVTDEAKVRLALRDTHGIEIGAGLGPLAGKIWRVGLMGAGATSENVQRLVARAEETEIGGLRPEGSTARRDVSPAAALPTLPGRSSAG